MHQWLSLIMSGAHFHLKEYKKPIRVPKEKVKNEFSQSFPKLKNFEIRIQLGQELAKLFFKRKKPVS